MRMNRRSFLRGSMATAAGIGLPAAVAAANPARGACEPPPAEVSTRLASLLQDYQSFDHRRDPIRAGTRGDDDALRRWPDDSPQAMAQSRRSLENFRARLSELDTGPLSVEDHLNVRLLAWRVDAALQGLSFDEPRVPFNSGEGFYTLAETTALTTSIRNEGDAKAWIARLHALPAYFETETANMQRGMADGFMRPRMTAETAAASVFALANEAPKDSALLLPLRDAVPNLSPSILAALLGEALTEVREHVRPAQSKLAHFFVNEYLPKAPASLAIRDLRNGAPYYLWLLRSLTTTAMSPEQVHALGLSEMARIRRSMDEAIAETGFHGPLADFVVHLKSLPQLFPSDSADLMARTCEIFTRANAALPRWFGKLPRLTCGILARPGTMKTSDGYLPGSPQQRIAGEVVLDLDNARNRPLHSLPAWVFHEGVPGHHLQIALAQERDDLPEFRRNDDITAYVEGWALYCEKLAVEMGLYRDAYERFGQLSMEMWRACRLVIDTGIHWMHWDYPRAVKLMQENTAMSISDIDDEVKRYIGWPGQALTYKIGELEIGRLRALAQSKLGSAFDIRRFHDFILDDGPMPMDMLGNRVEHWIAAQNRGASSALVGASTRGVV